MAGVPAISVLFVSASMKQFKTEAVILNTSDVYDTDRSFLLFTREFGKVRARAKGVRKPTSRLTGHLLQYLPTQLELIQTGGGYLIVQAQIASDTAAAYPSNPILFSSQAAIVAETINRLFIDADPHPVIYDGLVYTLERLRELAQSENEVSKAQLVAVEFLIKCLVELGYTPQLEHCVLTGEILTEDFLGWSSQLGGVLGEAGWQQAGGTGQRIQSGRTIVALRQFATPRFMAERLQMAAEVQKELCGVIYHYVQTQIGQPLKSVIPS